MVGLPPRSYFKIKENSQPEKGFFMITYSFKITYSKASSLIIKALEFYKATGTVFYVVLLPWIVELFGLTGPNREIGIGLDGQGRIQPTLNVDLDSAVPIYPLSFCGDYRARRTCSEIVSTSAVESMLIE
jgi:hypothetical protein